jgi:hypothetical protein
VNPAALVFLRDNVAAQRLAVAWPLAFGQGRTGKSLIRDWARLADVPPHQAEALAAVLRAHDICRDDGTLDKLAEQYVQSQVQTTLRGLRK